MVALPVGDASVDDDDRRCHDTGDAVADFAGDGFVDSVPRCQSDLGSRDVAAADGGLPVVQSRTGRLAG